MLLALLGQQLVQSHFDYCDQNSEEFISRVTSTFIVLCTSCIVSKFCTCIISVHFCLEDQFQFFQADNRPFLLYLCLNISAPRPFLVLGRFINHLTWSGSVSDHPLSLWEIVTNYVWRAHWRIPMLWFLMAFSIWIHLFTYTRGKLIALC